MTEDQDKTTVDGSTNPDTLETGDGEVRAEDTGNDAEGDRIRRPEFSDLEASPGEPVAQNLNLLMDVSVPITVELGHTRLKIEELLNMIPGSVIELDTRADEPVDLKVNGKLFARGEIVVVEDNFGIRVSEIVDPGALRNLQD